MDHKAVIAGLPPDRKVVLTERRDAPGLWRLTTHLGAILITGTLIALKVPGWPLLLPVQGVLLVFLFALEHECTHGTPFRTPALNLWVGRMAGLLILLPFGWFRYFHLAHHRYTNDPARDPELQSGLKPETWPAYLRHLTGWGYWAGNVGLLVRLVLGREQADYLPPARLPELQQEARAMLGLYTLAAASLVFSPVLFWVWLGPMLLGQPVLRLYLLAEHGRCPPVANMLENTRTTFTTGLVRWLAWNMPYHIEHHSFPGVPFHRLPDLHQDMAPHLKSTAPSYAAFTRDYAAALGQGSGG